MAAVIKSFDLWVNDFLNRIAQYFTAILLVVIVLCYFFVEGVI